MSTLTLPIFLSVLFCLLIFILADRILFFAEKFQIFQNFYDPKLDLQEDFFADLFGGESDFFGLDQKSLQVVTEIETKFQDVAGSEEAKNELKEVVRFLQNPQAFTKLGATVPKGVLLSGPPGTGKTLLAKAVAGESGTPFLQISGSQFVELLVGVGAARVRELFDTARSLKPCIIFIDEIDAIARTRSGTSVGGNDEREQTLNQLLTEMDGFESYTGVVVLAATNRVEILDPALKRPGRFDRQIVIGTPNLKEREAILKVHAKGKKLSPLVNLSQIAQRTIGFSGADLANLLNEAAILSARRKKTEIENSEVNTSLDRLLIGLEGKPIGRLKSRQLTAFHEMGHAFLASLIDENQAIEKLTLVPRGNTKGTTWTTPSFSQYSSRQLFLNQIFIALAGRAAEELTYGFSECTAGAQQDFIQLTRILRTMIVRYAMGRLQELKQQSQQKNLYFLGSDVKQELTNIVDDFITNFLDLTYQEVLSFLEIIRPAGERLVDQLLVSEELSGIELRTLAGEYVSEISSVDLLSKTRDAALFALLTPTLKKSVTELELEIKELTNRAKRG